MIVFSRTRLRKTLICQNFLKGEGPTLNLLSNTSQRAKTLYTLKVTTYVIGSKLALTARDVLFDLIQAFQGK